MIISYVLFRSLITFILDIPLVTISTARVLSSQLTSQCTKPQAAASASTPSKSIPIRNPPELFKNGARSDWSLENGYITDLKESEGDFV